MKCGLYLRSNTVARNQSKLRAVLEENIACALLRIDSDTVVCENGACCCGHTKLFGCKLEDMCEWRFFRDAENAERLFGIRSQCDLECNFAHFRTVVALERDTERAEGDGDLLFGNLDQAN
eukprot:TRINITY_DN1998_c0_g1_i2.p1 TRINITY_DN1998_c0_g1~~TRINITY_DN1998_c0_g1_i2.p1  ORF type:complete len:121 (-),score=7.59 TRINITY_DN1998_c0_g1_i2:10-372(-)